MSSRCRIDLRPCLAIAAVLLLAACDRERREFEGSASDGAPARPIVLSHLSPGPRPSAAATTVDERTAMHYEGNAYHVSEGQRLFKWYNCNGCHAGGGGSIGPALMDGEWRYGGSLAQIRDTIERGRPNGMPSFAGKIPPQQLWQLAAYVRSMSGNVRKDVPPSRREGMRGPPPLTRMPRQGEAGGDKAAVQVPQP